VRDAIITAAGDHAMACGAGDDVTFDLLLIAVAISVEPIPITGYILLLGSRGGTAKGWGYLAGWVGCFVVVLAGTALLTGGKPPREHTAPSTVGLIVRIVLGVALLALAWRQRRMTGRPKKEPKWQKGLDKIGVPAAAGLAVLLQPWGLVAAGAAIATKADMTSGETILTLIAFILIATSSYLIMQLCAVWRPEATARRLQGLQNWIDTHRDAVLVVLYVAVGLWLVAKSAYLLF
jgi:Sap, sulfolipid-1-addressing protein